MITSMRRSAKSWGAAAILFIALVAIVITGFGTGGVGGLPTLGTGSGGETLASAGDEEMTEQEKRVARMWAQSVGIRVPGE